MTFIEYWETLMKIKNDCNVEQYYDEIIRPLFKESISKIDNVKVIPTFDTRYHGKDREKFKCVTGDADNLVWPDYVFVPLKYTHDNPISPYIKVEFKIPNIKILEGNYQMIYYPIYHENSRLKNEIKSELTECPLILTDGITWLFLKDLEDFAKLPENDKEISFVDVVSKYYSGNHVTLTKDASESFDKLKEEICIFIKNSKLYKTTNFSSLLS